MTSKTNNGSRKAPRFLMTLGIFFAMLFLCGFTNPMEVHAEGNEGIPAEEISYEVVDVEYTEVAPTPAPAEDKQEVAAEPVEVAAQPVADAIIDDPTPVYETENTGDSDVYDVQDDTTGADLTVSATVEDGTVYYEDVENVEDNVDNGDIVDVDTNSDDADLTVSTTDEQDVEIVEPVVSEGSENEGSEDVIVDEGSDEGADDAIVDGGEDNGDDDRCKDDGRVNLDEDVDIDIPEVPEITTPEIPEIPEIPETPVVEEPQPEEPEVPETPVVEEPQPEEPEVPETPVVEEPQPEEPVVPQPQQPTTPDNEPDVLGVNDVAPTGLGDNGINMMFIAIIMLLMAAATKVFELIVKKANR